MSTKNDITLVNQFGEKSINQLSSVAVAVSNAAPAKDAVTAVSAIATADLVAESISDLVVVSTVDATDLATALTLVNDIKAKYNLNVAIVNDIKAKYNLNVALTNIEKAQHNALLAALKVVA